MSREHRAGSPRRNGSLRVGGRHQRQDRGDLGHGTVHSPRAWGRRRAGRRRAAGGRAHGSPPRAWGRRHRLRCARRLVHGRFTPHARGDDKACRICDLDRRRPVHPHARGDDASSGSLGAASSAPVHPPTRAGDDRSTEARSGSRYTIGSPPRAWGRRRDAERRTGEPRSGHPHASGGRLAPPFGLSHRRVVRFTPTRVWGRRDGAYGLRRAGRTGSPPRAVRDGDAIHPRGAPWPNRTGARFTPTRVGTTPHTPLEAPPSPVHPHARGDDGRATRKPPVSFARWRRMVHPHARGDDGRSGSHLRRFTPTRVGTTAAR